MNRYAVVNASKREVMNIITFGLENGESLVEDTQGTVSPGDVYDGSNFTPATLTVSADKTTITADGTDTATITAQVSDSQWAGEITFTIAGADHVVTASAGKATFTVSSSTAGDIVVDVSTSDTNPATGGLRWGTGSITITAQ